MKPFRTASLGAIVATLGMAICSCNRDVRLDDQKVRSVTVKAVSHYGETLDENASPERVAYVALRAIREDALAQTDEEREKALDTEFDVCAADELQRVNGTSRSRDEWVHSVVYHWTPTVDHYAADLPTSWEDAKKRLVNRGVKPIPDHPGGANQCELAMVVADPSGDPRSNVVLLVWLAEDSGFWRVTHFGFDRTTRSLGVGEAASAGP